MFSRRDFMKTAAVSTAAVPLAHQAGARHEQDKRPLRAEPQPRTIFARPREGGDFILFSDASPTPRPLVRRDALEREFGKGMGDLLTQPDHWRMIAEGWFTKDDLFVPLDPSSQEYAVWRANYHPYVEAHDILIDIFGGGLFPWGGRVHEFGLEFAEHPFTPRQATVTLWRDDLLPALAQRVADHTDWISVHPISHALHHDVRTTGPHQGAGA